MNIDNAMETVIHCEMTVLTAMCIIGNIQLATRHPANTGPSVEFAEDFARQLQKEIEPFLNETQISIMQMGWNSIFDM